MDNQVVKSRRGRPASKSEAKKVVEPADKPPPESKPKKDKPKPDKKDLNDKSKDTMRDLKLKLKDVERKQKETDKSLKKIEAVMKKM